MHMPELHTERLIVRALRVDDVDHVLRVLGIPSDNHDERKRIERYVEYNALAAVVLAELGQPPYGDRGIVLRSSGDLIGLAGLVPAFLPFDQLQNAGGQRAGDEAGPALNRPEIGLYYEVDPDHRGHGYATEAAEALLAFALGTLRCARIVATTERENAPSQAVMRHLGMRLLENPFSEPGWLEVVGVLDHQQGPGK